MCTQHFAKNYSNFSASIAPEWAILAKRWVVTWVWLNHFRRLPKDDDIAVAVAENRVMIAHSIF
jgi:hypothetical protein